MSEKTKAIIVIAAVVIILGGWFAWNQINAPEISVPVNYRAPIAATAAK